MRRHENKGGGGGGGGFFYPFHVTQACIAGWDKLALLNQGS